MAFRVLFRAQFLKATEKLTLSNAARGLSSPPTRADRSPSTGRCHSTPIARVIVSRYFDLPATILIVVDDGIPHEKDQPIAYELKGALSYRKCGA